MNWLSIHVTGFEFFFGFNLYRELLKHSERCAFLLRYLSCQLKFRFRAAERTAGGGGRAEGRKGNREVSEEGSREMPSCVGY